MLAALATQRIALYPLWLGNSSPSKELNQFAQNTSFVILWSLKKHQYPSLNLLQKIRSIWGLSYFVLKAQCWLFLRSAYGSGFARQSLKKASDENERTWNEVAQNRPSNTGSNGPLNCKALKPEAVVRKTKFCIVANQSSTQLAATAPIILARRF